MADCRRDSGQCHAAFGAAPASAARRRFRCPRAVRRAARPSASTSIGGGPASRSTGAIGGASTSTVVARHRRHRISAAAGSAASAIRSGRRPAASAACSTELRRRLARQSPPAGLAAGSRIGRNRLGRRQKLVGLARFGAPDRAAAHAADLAPVRLQACQLDIVGCSAGRADDQHRRIRAAAPFGATLAARSVNGLETNRPGGRRPT